MTALLMNAAAPRAQGLHQTFPGIYSSGIKLCTGEKLGNMGEKLRCHCSSANLAWTFFKPHPAKGK